MQFELHGWPIPHIDTAVEQVVIQWMNKGKIILLQCDGDIFEWNVETQTYFSLKAIFSLHIIIKSIQKKVVVVAKNEK